MAPPRRTEDDWIREVARLLGAGPRVRVGIGDDAAIVDLDGRSVVVTADVLVDGVHFRLRECGARAAARKAVAVNVSDLAAMGAIPRGCVAGVVLPHGSTYALFRGLAQGFAAAARELRCDVVGGDTNVGRGPLVLAVTAFGDVGPGGPRLRRGARPGDELSVTGALGGSLLGRHLTFRPLVDAGLALASLPAVHAMMDLSDGLSTDLPRLCVASGVGAEVEAARVPIHGDVARARGRRTPLEHALHDGEDFELLVAHAPLDARSRARLARRGVTLHGVGRVTPGSGVRLLDGKARRVLRPGGYDHVRRPSGRRR